MQARLRGCSTFSITSLPFLFAAASDQHDGAHRRGKKRDGERKEKRDGDAMFGAWEERSSFVRFVVLGNRILIAWMPSKILADRATPAVKEYVANLKSNLVNNENRSFCTRALYCSYRHAIRLALY